MQKQAVLIIFAAASAFLLLNPICAYGISSSIEIFPLSVKDDLGNVVIIDKKPGAIASCALFLDEIITGIADKNKILAVSKFALDPELSNIAPDIASIPNKIVFNVETLISLDPDVLLVADWSPPDGIKQLRASGMNVCIFRFPITIEGIRELIRKIALIAGEKEKGEAVVSSMDKELSKIKKILDSKKNGARATVLDYNPTYGSSFGRGSLWDDMVSYAGLINVASGLKSNQWGTALLSREKIIDLDPDIIILPGWVYGDDSGSDKLLEGFTEDPLFRGLRAVKSGRVFRIAEKYRYSGSQYATKGAMALSMLAYPELFE